MKKLYTAICFFSPKEEKPPLKYRNINNLEKFIQYMETKGVLYANFYGKDTKLFIERRWLKEHR